jgi:hypothetical protein
MTTTKKLNEMPYAQAQVIIRPNLVELQSYETIVAFIEDGWLYVRGLYSMTTRKHLKAFCKEFCGFDTFSTIKTLALEHMRMNVYTGEVEVY